MKPVPFKCNSKVKSKLDSFLNNTSEDMVPAIDVAFGESSDKLEA